MTSPGDPTSEPKYPDHAYRSLPGVVSGVLLLGIGAWLTGDAVVRGTGRTPWLALAGMLAVVPMVVAFTVRPAVLAGAERLLVRNPFRTITIPWAAVDDVRAGYSSEVHADGRTYQLWAIPVSLRQRKRANRGSTRGSTWGSARGARSPAAGRTPTPAAGDVPRAWSDAAVAELRDLAERNRNREGSAGDVTVRWCWEVIAPALAGMVVLAVILLTR